MHLREFIRWILNARRNAPLLILGLCLATLHPVQADPLDEAYWQTFYLTTNGDWGNETPVPAKVGPPAEAAYPQGIGSVAEYRASLLGAVGGAQPPNLKIGISEQAQYLNFSQGAYFDYIFDVPNEAIDMLKTLRQAVRYDTPMSMHFNGYPWGDTNIQSMDFLSNYLEKFNNGIYLQRDRNGNFRGGTQDPTRDEAHSAFSPQLEMQVTLSRKATGAMAYIERNVRQAARVMQWFREERPDIVIYAINSSEFIQNDYNSEWFDYSTWSRDEFREWLSGTGFYAGRPGSYATIADLNNDANLNGATGAGFPFASFAAVNPPTTVNWSTLSDTGRWWRLWHSFRITQVQQMTQAQNDWMRECGWAPDRIYGCQIPFDPNTTADSERRVASPWTTSFTQGGSNGITRFGIQGIDSTLWTALASNDKNWGITDYHPLSTNSASILTTLNQLWTNRIHAFTPYFWGSQEQFRIQGGTAYETAIQQFLTSNQTNRFTGLERYEADPESRDVIWTMRELSQVEVFNQLAGAAVSTGTLSATITGADPFVSLRIDDPVNKIATDAYYSFECRMNVPQNDTAQLFWSDGVGTWSATFPVTPGMKVYRLNLMNLPTWQNKQLTILRLDPTSAATSGQFQLDWAQLKGNHSWLMDDPNEIYTPINLGSQSFAGGQFSATDTQTGGGGYFHFSTDKRDPAVDADRAFINADVMKVVRIRMNAGTAATANLYWWKAGSAPFFTSFPVTPGWQTYTLDLSAVANWDGSVTRLRLDPLYTQGASFALDSLTISPKLLAPRPAFPDLLTQGATPEFRWDRPVEPDRAALNFDFQLATDFKFTGLVDSQTNLATTHYVRQRGPWLDGNHWWRVRSRDGSGNVSPWSIPMPVFFRKWGLHLTGDVQGVNDFGAVSTSGGIWQGTTGDVAPVDGQVTPILTLNTGSPVGRGINADLFSGVRLRVKISGGTGVANGQMMFFPDGVTPTFVPLNMTVDNQWRWYDVSFAPYSNWKGYIPTLWFFSGTRTGLTVAIDEIQMITNRAPALPPAGKGGYWDFATAGNDEGWQVGGTATGGNVTGSAVSLSSTGTQPLLTSPEVRIDAGTQKWVHVRMRNQTASTTARLYWSTNLAPGFSPARSVAFPVVGNDTVQRDYDVSLAAVGAWSDQVTQIQLQPSEAPGTSTIDLIEVTPNLVPVELSEFATE